jgi:glycerophosphoryl diester phosphodiesterase
LVRRWSGAFAAVALTTGIYLVPASHPAYPPLSAADSHFLVIAHRGFSAVAPENTLPSVRAAIQVHASKIELDVQRTKDGKLVVLHDLTLARTTNVAQVFPGRQNDPVGTFTLGQVEQLDAGSWFSPRFADTRVPTLSQVLDVVAPSDAHLMIELKNPGDYPGYERQVAEQLAAHHLTGSRVEVHSFYPFALHEFHRYAPGVPLSVLVSGQATSPAAYRWAQAVEPEVGDFSESFVDQARADGLAVYAWDTSSGAQMEHLADWGVNGVTTNQPKVAFTELDTAVSRASPG